MEFRKLLQKFICWMPEFVTRGRQFVKIATPAVLPIALFSYLCDNKL